MPFDTIGDLARRDRHTLHSTLGLKTHGSRQRKADTMARVTVRKMAYSTEESEKEVEKVYRVSPGGRPFQTSSQIQRLP